MEMELARARLTSLYALIDDLADEEKIGHGAPSLVLLDGNKIVVAEPQEIGFECSPVLAEFLQEHAELWNELGKAKWKDAEARELVEHEQSLWDTHFG